MNYRGWICAIEADKEELEKIGVKILAPYKKNANGFGDFPDCAVSQEAFEALDEQWGRWIWAFKEVE